MYFLFAFVFIVDRETGGPTVGHELLSYSLGVSLDNSLWYSLYLYLPNVEQDF